MQYFGTMPPRKKARTATRVVRPVRPDGPLSKQDVSDWPGSCLGRALAHADSNELAAQRVCRLRRWLHCCHTSLTSDYSGYECFREALRCGYDSASQHFATWNVAPPTWRRSCDIDTHAQQILCWYSSEFDKNHSCVLPDLNMRLPADEIKELDKLEPGKNDSLETKVKKRQEQALRISSRKAELFHAESSCVCLTHPGRRCRTLPQMDPEDEVKDALLRVNVAGTCCQGWSREGKQERQGHVSERVHAIWLCEREMAAKLELEDAFVQECTTGYPWVEKIRRPLANSHRAVRVKVSPVEIAVPSSRPRSYVIASSLATLVWLGPESDDEVQLEFEDIFFRKCIATGDVFLNAADAEINSEMHRLALVQGHAWAKDFNVMDSVFLGEEDIMLECLPPGGYERFRDWENVRRKKGKGLCTWLADCHHHAESKGPAAGSIFPCELRSSCVIAHHVGRAVTPFEALAAHGWHMHDVGGKCPISPVRKYFDTLKKSNIGKLAGNGISLPVAWCVWLYFISNIAPREFPKVSRAEALLSCSDEEEDFEDWK